MEETDYSKSYSEEGFWKKVSENTKSIGKATLLDALKLYYAIKTGNATPMQIAAIIAALGYLICPIDAVPDFLGPVGYADDAGVLTAAVATLKCCAKEVVVDAAKQKLREWFD